MASQLSKTDSLNAKLELLKADETLTPQQKLQLMQVSLSSKEWNCLNGRFNTARKNEAEVDQAAKEVKRSDWKTLVGSYTLDPTMSDVYQSLTHNVSSCQKMVKEEEWLSWTEILTKWSEEEVCAHLESGRIITKECPDTPGVWIYQDTNKVKVQKQLARGKALSRTGKEQLKPESKEQDEVEWDHNWTAFGATTSFNDLSVFGSGTWKGSGKKGLLNKGKGKGKNKGKLDPEELVDIKRINLLKGQVAKTVSKLGCFALATEGKAKTESLTDAFSERKEFQKKLEEEGWTNEAFGTFSEEVTAKLGKVKKDFQL